MKVLVKLLTLIILSIIRVIPIIIGFFCYGFSVGWVLAARFDAWVNKRD